MITNSTSDQAFLYSWMFAIKPTWSMSSAVILGNTFFWNVVTSLPGHAIPAWRQRSIALNSSCAIVTRCTVNTTETFVIVTFSWFPLKKDSK